MALRLTALLLLGASAAAPAAAQTPDSLYRAHAQWLLLEAPLRWFGNSRSAIVTRLGPASRTSARLIRQDPPDSVVLGTLYTLSYPGVVLMVYRQRDAGDEFLVDVTVTAPPLVGQSPIRIGSRRADVRRYFLDSLTSPHADQVEYTCCDWLDEPVSPTARLHVWFRGDRVVKLEWHYSVD